MASALLEPLSAPLASFKWADAPFTNIELPLITGVIYVIVSLTMSYAAPSIAKLGLKVKMVQAAHNMVLCLGSLAMALGTLHEVIKRSSAEGSAMWLFCESASTPVEGALFGWSYIYYLSKYYELLDTLLALIKGRPPPHFVLHVYHHTSVLLMSWAWLEHTQSLQQIGLIWNTTVHVVMYYYYFWTTLGYRLSWKGFVTIFQCIQFTSSLFCFAVTLYLVAMGNPCSGMIPLSLNIVFYVTLLYLFIQVYRTNKRRAQEKKL